MPHRLGLRKESQSNGTLKKSHAVLCTQPARAQQKPACV